jgi:cytochrome c
MKHLGAVILSLAGVIASAQAGFAQRPFSPEWSVLEAEQTAGRQVFRDHCASCHARKPNQRIAFGPNLKGVVGRKAASVPGFPYSEALKKSGLIWTEDNLKKWIADSATMVPGTLMAHVSISDPAEQIYLVSYLKTLKASAH